MLFSCFPIHIMCVSDFLQMFDERTGKALRCPMTFWSKYGEKIHRKKSERMYDVVSTAD